MKPRHAIPLAILAALVLAETPADAGRIWFDGSRDDEDGPPGRLLSDNIGYWGDVILTGVTYRFQTPPDAPPDAISFGGPAPNRLLDGRVHGYRVGVGKGPLIVVFDFKRSCTFNEIDLATLIDRTIASKFEVGSDGSTWRTVHERPLEQCPPRDLHRFVLAGKPTGRFLRLTLRGPSSTRLAEVWVWGDAPVVEGQPEAYRPRIEPEVYTEVAYRSIPGIPKTAVTDHAFHAWRMRLGDRRGDPAVWSRVPTWGPITDRPILPDPAEPLEAVDIVMARNETEPVAVALTTTRMERSSTVRVELSRFSPEGRPEADAPGIRGKLRIAGAIPSRDHGVNIGPLFEADNLPGASLLRRYLTNGPGVEDFPQIQLSPSGSAVLWLSVTTRDAPPGDYRAVLACADGPKLQVRVRVLDVTLPDPFIWLHTWSYPTSMRSYPFVYADRREREVDYMSELGLSSWLGRPSPEHPGMLMREKGGRVMFALNALGDLEHIARTSSIEPDEVTDGQKQYLRDYITENVENAKKLGLGYDEFCFELWDEPGKGSAASYRTFAQLIKAVDPNANIYANPCFWAGWSNDGVHGDDVVYEELNPWYNQLIDVSVPLELLVQNPMPRSYLLFDKPGRLVNAFYNVNGQHGKSERQVPVYRQMAWDAFRRGWNGWAFYSYYAPRGNPWDDFDKAIYGESMPDYQIAYPGPRGPVATRQTESVREGREDFRLLTLLKQRGLQRELDAILHAQTEGESFERLRSRALRLAAGSKER